MSKRRKHTKEFKLQAVKLVKDQGVSIAQASRDLDLHFNVLQGWVKAYEADTEHAFPGHGKMKPEQEEIARLKKEIAKLKMERDILKKATRPSLRRKRSEIRVHCKAPRNLAGQSSL